MQKKSHRGFTLIELMVTVAVAAILFGIAAPDMRNFITGYRLRTVTNDLAASLAYARSESIKRGWPVTLCKSANPAASQPSCSTSSADGWAQGWLVFVDRNGDKTLSSATDELLRVVAPEAGDLSISTGNNASVTYKSTGVATGGGSTPTPADFTLCLNGSARTVELKATGRTDVLPGAC